MTSAELRAFAAGIKYALDHLDAVTPALEDEPQTGAEFVARMAAARREREADMGAEKRARTMIDGGAV